MMTRKISPLWWRKNRYFLLLLLIFGGISISLIFFLDSPPKQMATLTIGGEVIEEIDLAMVTSPYEFTLEGQGRYHEISVRMGEIAVIVANCPDQICVKQGYENTSPIICLPHELMISFSGEVYDVISG